MFTYRAYARSVVNITLCGNVSVRVASPGLATTTITGGNAGDCAFCQPVTFAYSSIVARDYVITTNETTCGVFEPTFTVANAPAVAPAVKCVANCATNHVTGGTAVVNPVSFMVSVQQPWYGTMLHFCGGTLIRPGVVLTAAHCVAGDLVAEGMDAKVKSVCGGNDQCFSAVVGSLHWRTDPVGPGQGRLTVVGWAHHPDFNKNRFDHDVALLRINGDFDYSKTEFSLGPWSNPPHGTTPPPAGSYTSVLGWGLTEDGTGRASETLLNGTMPYVNARACILDWAEAGGAIAKDVVCAQKVDDVGQRYVDACNGDSGGPLLLMGGNDGSLVGAQVGVVSNGVQDCKSSLPGVYAATADASNAAWILGQLAAWQHVPAPAVRPPSGAVIPKWVLSMKEVIVVLLPTLVAALNLAVALALVPRRTRTF